MHTNRGKYGSHSKWDGYSIWVIGTSTVLATMRTNMVWAVTRTNMILPAIRANTVWVATWTNTKMAATRMNTVLTAIVTNAVWVATRITRAASNNIIIIMNLGFLPVGLCVVPNG